jgi:ketosteroid isomerase-like protein
VEPEHHRPYPHPALIGLYVVCLLIGGGAVVFACVAVSRPPPQDAIRQVLDDQVAAWNRADLDGFMAGYWNSPDLSFYSGKDKKRGWQETFNRYRARYQAEGKEMGSLTFTELDIEMLGSDTALVRGRWKVDMSKESLEGLFTLLMRRFPAGWRIVHDHTSSG